MERLNDILVNLLKTDSRYFTDEGELLKNAVYEDAMKMETSLIKILLSDDTCKARFFTEVDGVLVFDKVGFGWVINNRQFLPDSFTRYKNKIGLVDNNGEFLSSSDNVVLAFPYKDCVLEFDSTDENEKRTEIFYNETLCHDDIDHLFNRKVFSNAQRHTKTGIENITTFNDENLVIKGNNLLSLYSLLDKYAGKIKCMYWDILYNTENDQVPYNDSFKHSSWLTMMKNRLEVAKKLLRTDGVICLQCDDNEMAYLKVLCDELFGREAFINCICIKSSEASGTKMAHVEKKFPKIKDYLLVYKSNPSALIHIKPIKVDNTENIYDFIEYAKYYTKIITNPNAPVNQWNIVSIKDYIKNEKLSINVNNDIELTKFKLDNADRIVYRTNNKSFSKYHFNTATEEIISPNGIRYIWWEGKQMLFLSEYTSTYLCDIWSDISTINLNKEGNVQLPNGKKPESLLRRIIYAFTNENDYVLDAYFGTGTTGAVALKMNRKFIGLEQLNSHYEKCKHRLTEVINGDTSGISSEVNWQGGGSFVSVELKTLNQVFVEAIQSAENDEQLASVWTEMRESGFISSYVSPQEIDPNADDFKSLSFDDKKRLLLALLDKNMLYVNYCDIDDETYDISEADKAFTNSFYKES